MSAEAGSRVADVVAGELARAGVRVAFGVPGGEVLTLIDALGRAGIEVVLARQESAAALMAQGVARESGVPGVVVATVGPGATSAVNGVAAAHQDRVPLLALTGALDAADLARGFTHQALDQCALFGPVTKRSLRLVDAEGAAGTIAEAIALARAPRPGAVHVDLPAALAAAAVGAVGAAARASASDAPSPRLDAESERALERIAERLAAAARPLVMIGLDAVDAAARAPVRALAHAVGAPVLTTYLAKGIVDEAAPLALGGFGLSPAVDAALLPLVRAADVILRLGYDPIETRVAWTQPYAAGAVLLDVAAVPAGPLEPAAGVAVAGALELLAPALLERVAGRPHASRWSGGEIERARVALSAVAARMDATPPGRLVEALGQALPADARVTVDTGAHRILLSQRWLSRVPGRLVQSTGLCTMACALPLALGIRRASPHVPVVAVVGDGGLEMCLGELATARELGGPLPIVVLDDRSLELIALKQRAMTLPAAGCESSGTDFASVARAMGGRGVRVESADALGDALAEALGAPTFTVLHCPIPRGSYDGVL